MSDSHDDDGFDSEGEKIKVPQGPFLSFGPAPWPEGPRDCPRFTTQYGASRRPQFEELPAARAKAGRRRPPRSIPLAKRPSLMLVMR